MPRHTPAETRVEVPRFGEKLNRIGTFAKPVRFNNRPGEVRILPEPMRLGSRA